MQSVKEALALARHDDFFKTWDTLASLRERFRDKTRLGVTGEEKNPRREEIEAFLMQIESSLSAGLSKTFTRDGLCTTYFINEVAEYEKLPAHPGSTETDLAPAQHVRALRFKQIPLSPFLEGPVHALRVVQDPKHARRIYHAVKSSDLYDRKLKMYKLNVPLVKESYEIGRNKIFTPGLVGERIHFSAHALQVSLRNSAQRPGGGIFSPR